MHKKRELQKILHNLINKLVDMKEEVCILEQQDSVDAARGLKRKIIDFKTQDLENFEQLAQAILAQVITQKKRK